MFPNNLMHKIPLIKWIFSIGPHRFRWIKRNISRPDWIVTCTIQIQPEKVKKIVKNLIFFNFFKFSGHARGPLKFFDIQFLKRYSKKSKNGFTRTYQIMRGTKS